VASPAASQIVTEVEFTVVEFTYWQLVTQEALDLWMKFGLRQVEQSFEEGDPSVVDCSPNGISQVALH